MKAKKSDFRINVPVKWYAILGIFIVIGSIMASGLTILGLQMFPATGDDTFMYMLGMILPMSVVMYFSIYAILRHINQKINPLLGAMHEVSEGNLDLRLDEKYADEYATLYRDFNKMVTELKATKDAMNAFVNEFAHEFKTPITSISGFADYLYETDDEIDKEERHHYLKIISEQSQRLVNLSQNTLLLSKVEATQILTDKEPYCVSEQLRNCAILFLNQLEAKGIMLNISEDTDFTYYGNQELMEQVWINLLSNAIKFTPEQGEITISETCENEKLRIAISDTGIGMDQETMNHIFEKYYQNDTTSMVKGNGIGLSIVKRIIDLCEGQLEVKSKPGEGSTFTVILPVTER